MDVFLFCFYYLALHCEQLIALKVMTSDKQHQGMIEQKKLTVVERTYRRMDKIWQKQNSVEITSK